MQSDTTVMGVSGAKSAANASANASDAGAVWGSGAHSGPETEAMVWKVVGCTCTAAAPARRKDGVQEERQAPSVNTGNEG